MLETFLSANLTSTPTSLKGVEAPVVPLISLGSESKNFYLRQNLIVIANFGGKREVVASLDIDRETAKLENI